MKKNLTIFLLLLIGCSPKNEKADTQPYSDMDVDFPVEKTIKVEPTLRQTFNIEDDISLIMVKEPLILIFDNNKDILGYCYDINSGEKLKPIASFGEANHEIIPGWGARSNPPMQICGDSLEFTDNVSGTIKTFALNDIATKYLGDRPFSTFKMNDTLKTITYQKINTSTVVGAHNIFPPQDTDSSRFFILDQNQLSYFGVLSDKLFNSNREVDITKKREQLRPIFAYHNDKVVTANNYGVFLNTIDVKNKTVVKERIYTPMKITIDERGVVQIGGYPSGYKTISIYCDEQHIYYHAWKSNDDKEKQNFGVPAEIYVLVYDWDLNPIKRYYVGSYIYGEYQSYLSVDKKILYQLKSDGDKKELYEYKLQ